MSNVTSCQRASVVWALAVLMGMPLSLSAQNWALVETFDGLDPASPSQTMLPRNFDFVVTHRTHPRDHQPVFPLYLADHGDDCSGPALPDPNQHWVSTSHVSSGRQPDESFFICRQHMMSSMGEVEGYSVTSFWPRQEFDFSNGGVLAFDVNVNDAHPRSWWEILITPREGMNVGAAAEFLPIDETYPPERIVFEFTPNSRRAIRVGSGQVAPAGWLLDESDWRDWRYIAPDDPALDDRTVRRSMRIRLLPDGRLRWTVQGPSGPPDHYEVTVPGGLPFTRGVVLFKTHAYTPEKDDNFDLYTYHWDNIRFSGPVVGRYRAFETEQLAYLQANGDRPIGDSTAVSIQLPAVGTRPVLFGQLHGAMRGQVLLSINGSPQMEVRPHQYDADDELPSDCGSDGWASFSMPLDPALLQPGSNQLVWTVGPRPACADEVFWWDGFSVKSLEVQFDIP